MITFSIQLKKFASKGEKSGWTYIEIESEIAKKLNKDVKISYRVKGKIDNVNINCVAILPMGDGSFILPVNGDLRKKLLKKVNDVVQVSLEVDNAAYLLNEEMMECINEEQMAKDFFYKMPLSHRRYYSKWVESAKTIDTKSKRIALIVSSLSKGENFSQMLRNNKKSNKNEY